jgi:hypothetical protein
LRHENIAGHSLNSGFTRVNGVSFEGGFADGMIAYFTVCSQFHSSFLETESGKEFLFSHRRVHQVHSQHCLGRLGQDNHLLRLRGGNWCNITGTDQEHGSRTESGICFSVQELNQRNNTFPRFA